MFNKRACYTGFPWPPGLFLPWENGVFFSSKEEPFSTGIVMAGSVMWGQTSQYPQSIQLQMQGLLPRSVLPHCVLAAHKVPMPNKLHDSLRLQMRKQARSHLKTSSVSSSHPPTRAPQPDQGAAFALKRKAEMPMILAKAFNFLKQYSVLQQNVQHKIRGHPCSF